MEGDKDIVKLTDNKIAISHDKTLKKKVCCAIVAKILFPTNIFYIA